MKRFKAVLFDLDGTLLDTLNDLADSMNLVLSQLGCPPHPTEAYKFFVGEGLETLVKRVLPADRNNQEMLERCTAGMVDVYSRNWAKKTKLYPGIPKLLKGLINAGLRLTILSNKPDSFTQKAVDHFLGD